MEDKEDQSTTMRTDVVDENMTTSAKESSKEESSKGLDAEVTRDGQNDVSPRNVHGISWTLVVVGLLSCMLIYAMDNTIAADIVPAVVRSFPEGVTLLPWLSVGFPLGSITVVMIFGKLYGMFDAKWLFIGSTVIFMAASALCGAAPNMNAEIVGRVFAGAGGQGMYFGVVTLLSVNTSNRERPTYLAAVGLTWGIGTVLGPIIGGAFVPVTWRWAFYINLIIGGIFTPVYLFLVPSFDPLKGTAIKQRVRSFDWLGVLFSTGAFLTLIMAISFGGTLYAWDSGSMIALWVVSGLLWIAFFLQQTLLLYTTKANRAFPMHLLVKKETSILFLCQSSSPAAGFMVLYYYPLYFQFTRGDTGIEAAVRMLPLIFMIVFWMMLSGALISGFGYYKPWYVVGGAVFLVGCVLMSRIEVSTSVATVMGYSVLVGVGGSFMQAGFAVAQGVVNDGTPLADIVTFMMVGQQSGVSVGLSMAGAIFVNLAVGRIHNILPNTPIQQIQGLITGTGTQILDTLPSSTSSSVLDAIVDTIDDVFTLSYVSAALCFLASLFLSWKKLETAAPAAPA